MKKRSVTIAMTKERPQAPTPRKDTWENPADQSGTWTFDATVAACYDDMLERSIPQFAAMREAVTTMALRFAVPRTAIVDLGCSLGGAMAPLVERLSNDKTFLGCDASMPMLAVA